jgi:hypothetical protein
MIDKYWTNGCMTERDTRVTIIHLCWIKYMFRWCDHGVYMCVHIIFHVMLMKLTLQNNAI